MDYDIRTATLLFINGEPQNPELFDKVQEFCEQEFGERLVPTAYSKLWVALEVTTVESYVVCGVAGIAMAVDCPLFHVHEEEDRKQRDRARKVRDKLLQRAASALQDQWGPGVEVFVHVKPEKQRFWAGFLRLIGAKAANRFVVKV